jgi:hypothetical protein
MSLDLGRDWGRSLVPVQHRVPLGCRDLEEVFEKSVLGRGRVAVEMVHCGRED